MPPDSTPHHPPHDLGTPGLGTPLMGNTSRSTRRGGYYHLLPRDPATRALFVTLLLAAALAAAFFLWRQVSPEKTLLLRLSDFSNGDATLPASAVSISADSRYGLSGGVDDLLRLWDLQSGRLLRVFSGHKDHIRAVAFSPLGKRVLSASDDRTLKLWDLNGEELRTFGGSIEFGEEAEDEEEDAHWQPDSVAAAAFTPDARSILSGGADGRLTLWDVESGQPKRHFARLELPIFAVAISRDGQRAASGGVDGVLRIWDIATGAELRQFKGHHAALMAVALSHDGRLALSASADETIKLWDLVKGKEVRTLIGHHNFVTAASFSADDRFILSGGLDGKVILWDSASGKSIKDFNGHKTGVLAVALSADGRFVLSGAQDGALLVHDARLP